MARTHWLLTAWSAIFSHGLIIEVGSGFSSLIAAEAAAKNRSSALICIEPFPRGVSSAAISRIELSN
jgi:tRNA G46 methylase TrmB